MIKPHFNEPKLGGSSWKPWQPVPVALRWLRSGNISVPRSRNRTYGCPEGVEPEAGVVMLPLRFGTCRFSQSHFPCIAFASVVSNFKSRRSALRINSSASPSSWSRSAHSTHRSLGFGQLADIDPERAMELEEHGQGRRVLAPFDVPQRHHGDADLTGEVLLAQIAHLPPGAHGGFDCSARGSRALSLVIQPLTIQLCRSTARHRGIRTICGLGSAFHNVLLSLR